MRKTYSLGGVALAGFIALLGLVGWGCGGQLLSVSGVADTDSGVPENGFCADVSDWDAARIQFENEVIALVNTHRSRGANCGGEGTFEASHPLVANEALRCAARKHSVDMKQRRYFDHIDPEGRGVFERVIDAGYDPITWGENIAKGLDTPELVMAGLMNSPGHCANIMRPQFTEIGVGYDPSNHWTQAFGAPR